MCPFCSPAAGGVDVDGVVKREKEEGGELAALCIVHPNYHFFFSPVDAEEKKGKGKGGKDWAVRDVCAP